MKSHITPPFIEYSNIIPHSMLLYTSKAIHHATKVPRFLACFYIN
jgi:hypothetical protein